MLVENETACLRCQTANPSAARFCMRCGHNLGSSEDDSPRLRFVTVVFCDVAGSTELAARLRPEVWSSVLDDYFAEVGGALSTGGGRLEKFIGDAVVGVFGADGGREDDALRAIQAAQDSLDRLATHAEDLQRRGVDFRVRYGIASGRVMASRRDSSFAIGAVMNRAARLQQAAEDDSIVIDLKTWLLVNERITTHPIGPVAAKGFDKALQAWQVGGMATPREDSRPSIVNQSELRRELVSWISTGLAALSPSALVLEGEPGVGKTRILLDARNTAEASVQCHVLMVPCRRDDDRLGTWPLYQLGEALVPLERRAGIEIQQGAREIVQTLEELRWTLERRVVKLAEHLPLLILVDDYPAAGEAVRTLIGRLRERDARLAILMSGREMEVMDGHGERRMRVLPLDEDHARTLLKKISEQHGTHLPTARAEEILRRSRGNPLYLQQLAMLSNDDSEELIPPSVEAAMGARLDRLTPMARSVLTCTGAWGGDVSLLDVAATCGGDERDFDAAVSELTQTGLLTVESQPEQIDCQAAADVAYALMTLNDRAAVHERIMVRLQELAQHRPEAIELAAVHAEKAHGAWNEIAPGSDAGRAAARRAASCLCSAARFMVSCGQLPRALALVERAREIAPGALDLEAEAGAIEAYALGALGRVSEALTIVEDLRSRVPDVANLSAAANLRVTELALRWDEDLLTEAGELAERAGDTGSRSRLLLVQGLSAARSGDYLLAEESLTRSHAMAVRTNTRFGLTEIHGNLALCLAYSDTPVAGALARCLDLWRETGGAPMLKAAVGCPAALLQCMAGAVDTADEMIAEAESVFSEIGHKPGLAGVQEFRSMIAELADDVATSVRAANEAAAMYKAIGLENAALRCQLRGFVLDPAGIPPALPSGAREVPWDIGILAARARALSEQDGRYLDTAMDLLGAVRGSGARLLPLLGCLSVSTRLGEERLSARICLAIDEARAVKEIASSIR
ncbi:adenylate/guanylate cyclase domain-containing protein [Nonomuraea sp. NPDC050536]|uniref:adenylate/guanylate cyclase domain-containing protein n=1 Tax=Nonomuraea sp. NPDC050536 TaxID=3364366 RepID=UPI0037C6E1F3